MSACINIKVTQINELNSLYFLTLYGDTEDILSFRYFDVDKHKTYLSDNTIEFRRKEHPRFNRKIVFN